MGGSKPKPVEAPFQQQQQQQNTFSLLGPYGTQEAKDLLDTNLDFGGNNYKGDAFNDYGNAYKDYSGKAYEDYSGKAYQDYGGNAYQGIKNDFTFNLDPGAGRRTDLAEQASNNRFQSSLNAGMPAFLRQQLQAKEQRDIRGQGAAEQQQAQYAAQDALQGRQYQSSLARASMQDEAERSKAQMRDASELNRANLRDASELNLAKLRDASELNRAQGINSADLARAQMADQSASQRTAAELERHRILLPQIIQTGGSGSSNGYNTQIMPGQQGWFGSLLQGAGSAVGGLAAGGFI